MLYIRLFYTGLVQNMRIRGFSTQYFLLICRQCHLHIHHRPMMGKRCRDDKWVETRVSVSEWNITHTDAHSSQCLLVWRCRLEAQCAVYLEDMSAALWTEGSNKSLEMLQKCVRPPETPLMCRKNPEQWNINTLCTLSAIYHLFLVVCMTMLTCPYVKYDSDQYDKLH